MISPEMGRGGWVICVKTFPRIFWYTCLLLKPKMHLPLRTRNKKVIRSGWSFVPMQSSGCCSPRLVVPIWHLQRNPWVQGAVFGISKDLIETIHLLKVRHESCPDHQLSLPLFGIASLYGFMLIPISDWLWMT